MLYSLFHSSSWKKVILKYALCLKCVKREKGSQKLELISAFVCNSRIFITVPSIQGKMRPKAASGSYHPDPPLQTSRADLFCPHWTLSCAHVRCTVPSARLWRKEWKGKVRGNQNVLSVYTHSHDSDK